MIMSENVNLATIKVDQFKEILNQQTIRAQLRNTLHDNAGAFMSSMIDLYSGDDYLQKCNPQEVAMECMKAASLKLSVVKALGLAYVVPYKNKPTFTIGYKGLIQLAQNSGMYKTINADTVYEGELIGKDKLSGMIDLGGERSSNKIIGYFAYIETLNGFEKILYMTKDDVVAWATKYSPSYSSGNSTPWKTEFDKMAQKTVLRRLIGTYGPKSIDMQTALANDDHGMTPQQEAKERANQKPIDIECVEMDPETGEVIESGQPEPIPDSAPAAPQEPPKQEKRKAAPPHAANKPADVYDPGF
jgi:recombination protein RecT